MNELRFFHDDIARRYGHPLRRIPFDLGLGCPNRDPDGSGGCIFCAGSGARAGHLRPSMGLREQAESGIRFACRQYDARPPYIAYLQAYTSTNAPVPVLRRLFNEILESGDFPVVIISTRPDCLPDDVVALIAELNRDHEVWVELGVQTSCDATLDLIRRGHRFSAVVDAVARLHAAGIRCAAHLILGLPGETEDTWARTARDVSALPFSALKMHHLQVVKGTALADVYESERFPVLDEFAYARTLTFFLKQCRDDLLLMRLCSETPESDLIAPKWRLDKHQFLAMFRPLFAGDSEHAPYLPERTADGSWTLYHPDYRQHYHSMAGAAAESTLKYIRPCGIPERLEKGDALDVLEIGFGLGFNASAMMSLCENPHSSGSCSMTSLELDRNVVPSALALPEHPRRDMLEQLARHASYASDRGAVRVLYGDARQLVRTLPDAAFDFVFLDAFSPEYNPELWTVDFLAQLLRTLKTDGLLATYSTAYPLLGAALSLRACLYASAPFGRKRPGLLVAKNPHDGLDPFPAKELDIARRCTVGIPWRDPDGNASRDTIRETRRNETAAARKAGMPKWLKNLPPGY